MRFFLALLLIPSSLLSQPAETFDEARRYYGAEEYETAEKIYGQLRASSTSTTEQAAAIYNLGLSYAADEQWAEAMAAFRKVLELADKLPPRLLLDAREALFMALVTEAQEAGKVPVSVNTAVDWLQEARQLLKEIQQNERGNYPEALTRWLNSVEAEVTEVHRNAFPINKNGLEAFWKVQLTLLTLEQQLVDLKALQNDSQLYKQYSEVYLRLVKELEPLFDNVKKLTPDNQRTAVDTLEKNIQSYISALESSNIEKMQIALSQAKVSMEEWSTQLFENEKGNALTLKLMALYDLALRGEFIPSKTVKVLLENYRSPESIVDDSELIRSQKYAELGEKALNNGQQIHARIYLEIGQNILAQKLYKSEKERFTTQDILTAAIFAQRHTAKLTRLLTLHSDIRDNALMEQLSQAQIEVVKILKTFPSSAYEEQKVGFTTVGTKIGRCQHRPWNEVFPRFYKGWAAAERAVGNNLAQMLQNQERSQRQLTEAYTLLSKPLPKDPDSCYKKTPPPPKGGGGEEQKKTEAAPIDTVMRQIQQMEKDDKTEKRQNVIRKGEKPW